MSIAQLKTRGRALRISKWCRTRRTNFKGAHADKMPLCLSFQYGGLQSLPIDWYSITQAQYGKCAKCTKCVGVLCQINLHPMKSVALYAIVNCKTKVIKQSFHEEWNLRLSDYALQCSINELQRFHRDWDLLLIWRRNITEIKLRSKRFCHIPRRSRSHLPNNHAQQLQAYSDHSASWWTDITTKRTRGTASRLPVNIEIFL